MVSKETFQIPPPGEQRKAWVEPTLMVYGDMTVLTQQCNPPTCKPKVRGMGDDWANNISTL